VFSFDPRCTGLCDRKNRRSIFGRQRKAAMIRKFFPDPGQRLYSSFGSFFACLMSAVTTSGVLTGHLGQHHVNCV